MEAAGNEIRGFQGIRSKWIEKVEYAINSYLVGKKLENGSEIKKYLVIKGNKNKFVWQRDE